MLAVDDHVDAARRGAAEFLGATYWQDFEAMIDHVAVAGSVDDVGERLAAYVEAGARHLILCPIHGDRREAAERLLNDVVRRL